MTSREPNTERSGPRATRRGVALVSLALGGFGLVAAGLAVCGLGIPAAWGASARAASAASASGGSVTLTGTIGGRSVTDTDESHPLRLSPSGLSAVDLQVTNGSPRAVVVRTIELKGEVVGLTFFDFETSVDLIVKAHHRTGLTYQLDLSGLAGQATGLIPGSLSLLDQNKSTISTDPLVTDVRGSIVSVYGLFGLGLLLLTLLALASTLLGVARHTLAPNRFRRAGTFLVPGVGLGFVLVFTLSALRVWLPSSGHWLTIVLAFAAAFFLLGFLSPSPVEELDEDVDEEAEGVVAESTRAANIDVAKGAPATARSGALETIVRRPSAEPEPTS